MPGPVTPCRSRAGAPPGYWLLPWWSRSSTRPRRCAGGLNCPTCTATAGQWRLGIPGALPGAGGLV